MEQEFYQGLAQQVRAIAATADPFTRRRLLDLAKRYDSKGGTARSGTTERPLPTPRTTPLGSIFSGPGEASRETVVPGVAAGRPGPSAAALPPGAKRAADGRLPRTKLACPARGSGLTSEDLRP